MVGNDPRKEGQTQGADGAVERKRTAEDEIANVDRSRACHWLCRYFDRGLHSTLQISSGGSTWQAHHTRMAGGIRAEENGPCGPFPRKPQILRRLKKGTEVVKLRTVTISD